MSATAILSSRRDNEARPLEESIRIACRRIPPLFPLKDFVAVNPFIGLRDQNFLDAAILLRRAAHADILMPASFFVEQIAKGRIEERDFRTAVRHLKKTLPANWLRLFCFSDLNQLEQALRNSETGSLESRIMTFADVADRQLGTTWSAFVVDEISKWCSAYFDQGQSSWRMPWRDRDLFTAWKQAACLDANPELMGLKAFRRFVAALPEDPLEVVAVAVEKLGVSPDELTDYLYRQLLTVSGWSSYVKYLQSGQSGQAIPADIVGQLLAVRLVYDLALFEKLGKLPGIRREWEQQIAQTSRPDSGVSIDLLARYAAQQALECAYQRQLMVQLRSNVDQPPSSNPTRKVLQAVFCIDVRSEVLRRSLETQSEEIETMGFAGFFGLPLGYLPFGDTRISARCPVLLKPTVHVRESLLNGNPGRERRLASRLAFWRDLSHAWNAFKTSAISCFSFVETSGLGYGVKLVMEAWGLSRPGRIHDEFGPRVEREPTGTHANGPGMGLSLESQVTLAEGVFRNLGLKGELARFVLLCGHGSQTNNNPYGSALDCGACGGHPGDANARLLASILNSAAVRSGLSERGFKIPEDTLFLAGLHNTTTDDVHIYDSEARSADQPNLKLLGKWLVAASKQARRERSPSLGLGGTPDSLIDAKVLERSRDWSQVRPEWGLAGNAAFIAAPRQRTIRQNLAGRVFLHNYAQESDPGGKTLELILTAPMVVASWINLQYYASTVNNRLFGSGNKVLHNVVGTFGVWEGNGGDLRTGLPLQSLHDGSKWLHEPLRLSVFVESSREAIDLLIGSNKDLRELLDNGWLHLFAMETPSCTFWQYSGNLTWEKAQQVVEGIPRD